MQEIEQNSDEIRLRLSAKLTEGGPPLLPCHPSWGNRALGDSVLHTHTPFPQSQPGLELYRTNGKSKSR